MAPITDSAAVPSGERLRPMQGVELGWGVDDDRSEVVDQMRLIEVAQAKCQIRKIHARSERRVSTAS